MRQDSTKNKPSKKRNKRFISKREDKNKVGINMCQSRIKNINNQVSATAYNFISFLSSLSRIDSYCELDIELGQLYKGWVQIYFFTHRFPILYESI